MSTPAAATTIGTPRSHPSPTPHVQASPQMQTVSHIRKEVACLFVVEGTARMQPHLDVIINAYVDPILKQLRSSTEGDERHPKTKITPILKYGMVIFGDYEPGSMVTVDRKYFTSDLSLFQEIFRNISCVDGGIVRNATNEGLVAALEMFDEYRTELEGMVGEPTLHCILISNSLPHQMGTRQNLDDKYSNYTLENIVQDMRKHDIHLSLISPSKGYADYERIVNEVNDKKAELHTVTNTVSPSHMVKLAGFKLPEKPAQQPTPEISKQETPKATYAQGMTTPKRLSEAVTSPQSVSSTESAKKRKRENVPGQINLPKATVDPAKFAQLAQKQLNVANASVSAPPSTAATVAPASAPTMIQQRPPASTQQPQPQITPSQQPQPVQQVPQSQPMPAQRPAPPQPQQIMQQPQQPAQMAKGATPPRAMPTPAQIQQLMHQRKLLMTQQQRTAQQQQQLIAINAALQKFAQMKSNEQQQQQQQNIPMSGSGPMATNATSSPMAFGGTQVRPPTVSDVSNTPQQAQADMQQRNINTSNAAQMQSMLTPQQRLMLAQHLNMQQQQQQKQAQQHSPQRPVMVGGGDNSNPSQQQMMQAQMAQQQQQPVQNVPIWTGQIVWHIKQMDNSFQEFTCFCGAFAMIKKGTTISREDYYPEMWPQRITIAGRASNAVANAMLNMKANEHQLPYCSFRPLDTSTAQDHNNFNLLIKNLDQQKSLARAVFSTNTNEPQHGLILTAYGPRLAGVLFARVPLPDFNNLSHPAAATAAAMAAQQQQRPQQQPQNNAGMTPNASNSNVPMTLMGMSMANMNPNMINNNAALLQALQRQQQQQQQSQPQQSQQQPSQQGMINSAAMGSPVNAMNGIRPGLTQQSLLMSNLNLQNTSMGGNNGLPAGLQMNANFSNLSPQALQELRQRMLIYKQQQQHQQQQQQQQAPSNDPPQM